MRRLARLLALPLFALFLSCADMPTAPRAWVDLSGRILDRDGTGLPSVHVYFESVEHHEVDGYTDPEFSVTVFTDVAGSYRARLPEGRYDVFIQPDYRSGRPFTVLRNVTLTRERPVFDYRYDGVRVQGTITGPGGTPLPLGEAAAYPQGPGTYGQARSNGGVYELIVPAGLYDLAFDSGDNTLGLPYIVIPNVSVANDTTINVVLDGIPIRGTVTGPDGAPLPLVRVAATTGRFGIRSYTYSRADGTYEIRVPPGSYLMHLEPWAAHFIMERYFGPFVIDAPRDLDFDMDGVEWTGVVRRASDSTPIADASVHVRETINNTSAYTRTDSSGAFRLVVTPNSLNEIDAYAGNLYAFVRGVIAGSDSTFDLRLAPVDNLAPARLRARPLPYAKPSGGAKWAGTLGGRSRISP